MNIDESAIYNLYKNNILTETLNFNPIPAGAKFQKGDIVIGRLPQNIRILPKKSIPYVNKPGIIVGRSNQGQSSPMYHMDYGNGKYANFSGNILDGPFKSIEAAKKYEDPKVQIDIADTLRIKPKILLTDWQRNPLIEKQLKSIYTAHPFNMTWFDEPKETADIGANGKARETQETGHIFILAERELSPGNKIYILRCNNNDYKLTKYSPYTVPVLSLEFDAQKQEDLINVMNMDSKLALEDYLEELKNVFEMCPIVYESGKLSDDDILNLLYNVDGDHIKPTYNFGILSKDLTNPFTNKRIFNNYVFEGDYYVTNKTDCITCPKEIVGTLFLNKCINVHLTSLAGIPKATKYVSDIFTQDQIERYIEGQEILKSVDPETGDLFGGMLDSI